MSILRECNVFYKHPGRMHPTFPNVTPILEQFNVIKFKDWAKTHILKCKLQFVNE